MMIAMLMMTVGLLAVAQPCVLHRLNTAIETIRRLGAGT